MQFRCNSCGGIAEVPQDGADGNAGAVEPSSPPNGWRTIWTVIEEATNGRGEASTSVGWVSHSCPDCNVHMSVSEHHEAEFRARRDKMGASGAKDLE